MYENQNNTKAWKYWYLNAEVTQEQCLEMLKIFTFIEQKSRLRSAR